MTTPRLQAETSPPYLAAAVASAAVLVLYILTLGPSTAMWDTSEYIAAAYTLGIPHPPGNPLFVLIGRVFTILPIAPNVAMRVNLLAAVSSAVTAGIWFLVTDRVLSRTIEARWLRFAGAGLAALIGATAFTVWAQSVVNEKVYTVALAGLAIVSWLVIRWCDAPEAPRADKLLLLAAYLMGLGYANHMAGVLTLPAIGLAVLIRRPATLLRWRLVLGCAALLVLGATPFATQPIRAAHFPAINEGEPTGCATELTASCTFSSLTYDRFEHNFNRGQYAKQSVLERQAPIGAQVAMWWLYFKWQWLRDVDGSATGLQAALAAIFLMLGLFGGWIHYRRDPTSFAYFGSLMATITIGLIYYLNFKYGASQPPDTIPYELREVRDRDYFYLWSFSAWGVWAALGIVEVWKLLANGVSSAAESATGLPPMRSWAIASPVLAIAFVPLFANWTSASRRGDTDTADYARDLLNSVEPYGILVTVGDNDMFPLWYAQEVEGVRRDVTIANTSLMGTDWFVRQMIRRPIYAYNASAGPALYRDREWTAPTGPALRMTFDEADAVPHFQAIRDPMQFVAGNLQTTLTPRTLERSEYFIYRLILDNPDRPVHFANSSTDFIRMELDEYAVMHGLTRKIMRDPVQETDTVRRLRGAGWVDLHATLVLWDAFEAPASLIRKGRWVDRPSLPSPTMYVRTGLTLSDTMLIRGDTASARRIYGVTRSLAEALDVLDYFPPPPGETTGPLPEPVRERDL